MWGGIECTVNRVGDRIYDQTIMSGHEYRIDDLDRIASLGIEMVRYPVIWERIEPILGGAQHWRWQDARMERMRSLGLRPIATLLHHGSGPIGIDLLDPAFPAQFARFAGQVAERYPWLTHVTPVNEPVTTARFATLYGFWFPHRRDLGDFAWAVWHQCRAIQLGMQAIRAVVPDAVCVLTDDYGRVHSTRLLEDQAAFENERRWLALDLLFGRVTPGHRFWPVLRRAGISARALHEAAAEPLESATVGVDYYLTSERFLDHRLERYPAWTHGGNGREAYADVEAIRARLDGIEGLGRLLRQVWQRYQRPLAVTEAFLGAPRHQQSRWLEWVWDQAQAARVVGVPVAAVTAWALFGSWDWDSLVTRRTGYYEPGAFDTGRTPPAETDLADWIRATVSGRRCAPQPPGWWETSERLLYPPLPMADANPERDRRSSRSARATGQPGPTAIVTAREQGGDRA